MSKTPLVVVMGMHRSGTSALTRGLMALGIDLGDNLIPGIEGQNDRGFWEDADINALNETLLANLGSRWHRLSTNTEIFEDFSEQLLHDAIALLEKNLKVSNYFGFKDPRVAILQPFWQKVFDALLLEPRYVICVRNPLAVAHSLSKRDGFPFEKSFLLWSKYTFSAMKYTSGSSRVVVDYDNLLEDPSREMLRVAAELGISLSADVDDRLAEYAETFLSSELRHSCFQQHDLDSCDSAPPYVPSAYALLSSIARDEAVLDDTVFLAAWSDLERAWKAGEYLHIYMDVLDEEKVNASKTIDDLRIQNIDALSAIERLESQLSSTQEAFKTLELEVSSKQEAVKTLELEVSSKQEAVKTLELEVSSKQEVVKTLELEVSTKKEAINQLDTELSSTNEAVKELEAEVSSKDELLKQQEFKEKELNVQLEHYKASFENKVADLNQVLDSNSWKFTRRLRDARRYFFTVPYMRARATLSNSLRYLWRNASLSMSAKSKIKNSLFSRVPWLFRGTVAYKAWLEFNAEGPLLSSADKKMEDTGLPVPPIAKPVLRNAPVRLLAFYLPQFHPIPENDEWWGEGFTEWTKVRPAQPQFPGHYQPHEPAELGYYDLRDRSVQKNQIDLAKLYGIGGFCFYFYWFGGKRLLEAPLLSYLNSSELDFPFCLCWANENWSRRWDGLDSHTLIEQNHSETDDIEFIQYVSKYLHDSRYIRIGNKPLLLIYRPDLLPSAKSTTARWRRWCVDNGIGEIYLAYTQSFTAVDPSVYGMDAAVEFPPNNTAPPIITDQVAGLDKGFVGTIYDWSVFVHRSRKYSAPDFKLFRGVNPGWDNTARRNKDGAIFLGSTPDGYREWLTNAVADTVKRFEIKDERLVFVNAWNEWAEGAHLEPDQRYGHAYLAATREALERAKEEARRIVLVGHDAHPHGAQYLMLNLIRTLRDLNLEVDLVLLGPGVLTGEYRKYAQVHLLNGPRDVEDRADVLADQLYRQGVRYAITNTAVSGRMVAPLKRAGMFVTSLIHELPKVIVSFNLLEHTKEIAEFSDRVVFAADAVLKGFNTFESLTDEQTIIKPQGLYKATTLQCVKRKDELRRELVTRLKLGEGCRIVLGVGFADHRKGIDLFVDIGARVVEVEPDAVFIWVGNFDEGMRPQILRRIDGLGLSDRFVFPGLDSNTDSYYAAADVFALTSREDPFPSVVLEALSASVPVVAFKDAGGSSELLQRGCGELVDGFNVDAFADAIVGLLGDPEHAASMGRIGHDLVKAEYSFRRYVMDLLAMGMPDYLRVSVIVPNYNYADYLRARIRSIEDQTYAVYELVILDDASTDNSIEVIEELLEESKIDSRLVSNNTNSGSPFEQWRKGAEAATGDLLWIAEADDLSMAEFLEEVVQGFSDPEVVMSYCQSKQMAENGGVLSEDYLDYTSDISTEKWQGNHVSDGIEEIRSALSVKNTIPNVSAVLFRRDVFRTVLRNHIDDVKQFRNAGDWVTYVHVLKKGKIAFFKRSLNLHRRHQKSVTISNFNTLQLEEITSVQRRVRQEFKPDEKYIAAASAYQKALQKQFGLS